VSPDPTLANHRFQSHLELVYFEHLLDSKGVFAATHPILILADCHYFFVKWIIGFDAIIGCALYQLLGHYPGHFVANSDFERRFLV